jgi:hypothetical protein
MSITILSKKRSNREQRVLNRVKHSTVKKVAEEIAKEEVKKNKTRQDLLFGLNYFRDPGNKKATPKQKKLAKESLAKFEDSEASKELAVTDDEESEYSEIDYDDLFTNTAANIVHRRRQVHRLRMSNGSVTDIAEILKVSPATVSRDIVAIKDAIKRSIYRFDFPLYIGDAIYTYDVVKSMAMRMTTPKTVKGKAGGEDVIIEPTTRDKQTALRLVLDAEKAKMDMMEKLGILGKGSKINGFISKESEDNIKETEVEDFVREVYKTTAKRGA